MTIKEAVQEFLEHYAAGGRPSARAYRPCLDKLVMYCGAETMDELRVPQSTDRVYGCLRDKGLDTNTLWYVMTVIRVFLRFHREQGNTEASPRNVYVPKRTRRRRRAVTIEEHNEILSSVPLTDFPGIRDAALLMVLADTGMRVSEVAAIRIGDVDWERSLVRLRTAKTHAEDIACWSEATNDFLTNRYLPMRSNLPCGCEYLFTARECANGAYRDGITARSIQRIVRDRTEAAGFSGITPHKYRHGKAYAIHEKGGTLADIRNILRHSSLESSLSYLNMFEREDADRMKRFLD